MAPVWVAMAKGKYFSNCSGPLIIRLKRSDSTRLMNSSNRCTRFQGSSTQRETLLPGISPGMRNTDTCRRSCRKVPLKSLTRQV